MGSDKSKAGISLRDRHTVPERGTGAGAVTGALNASSDDMLSVANDDLEDRDGDSLESSTQYSEEKDDDEDEEEEEVIMLSVVLNPAEGPFHGSKIFNSALDCPEAISPIYL
jgi:hypothetical protein